VITATWYSVRYEQCMDWQLTVFPKCLYGGLKGKSTYDAELLPAVLLQDSQSGGIDEVGLTHDRKKCFNRIKSTLAAGVLKALGLDEEVVNAYVRRYRTMVRRFRFGKAHSEEMRSMSLIEGCSWSVLSCNAVFSVLARRVLRLTPNVSITLYIDDSKLRSQLEYFYQLSLACEIFRQFDILSDQECNAGKCRAYGTSVKARVLAVVFYLVVDSWYLIQSPLEC
jgi:hypothetical protein